MLFETLTQDYSFELSSRRFKLFHAICRCQNNGKRNILSFYSQKRTTKLGVPLQFSVLQKHKVDGANNEWWINSGINPT